MSRIRTIKPEFWTDSKTGTLTEFSKCLFLGLLNQSDDFGVLKYNLDEWRAQIFPYHYDTTPGLVGSSVVGEILPRGLIQLFKVPLGDWENTLFAFIRNFKRHQVINKPSLPLLEKWEKGDTPKTYAEKRGYEFIEYSGPENKDSGSATVALHPGRERKGKEGKGTTTKALPAPNGTGDEIEVVGPEHKPPQENAPAFNWLSYNFYLARLKVGDEYFNPWDPKHLKICKGIVETKARGNYEEARRRAVNLVLHNRVQPNYYKITPQDLSGKWTDLNNPPVLAPGMRGLREAVFQDEMDQIKAGLSDG